MRCSCSRSRRAYGHPSWLTCDAATWRWVAARISAAWARAGRNAARRSVATRPSCLQHGWATLSFGKPQHAPDMLRFSNENSVPAQRSISRCGSHVVNGGQSGIAARTISSGTNQGKMTRDMVSNEIGGWMVPMIATADRPSFVCSGAPICLKLDLPGLSGLLLTRTDRGGDDRNRTNRFEDGSVRGWQRE